MLLLLDGLAVQSTAGGTARFTRRGSRHCALNMGVECACNAVNATGDAGDMDEMMMQLTHIGNKTGKGSIKLPEIPSAKLIRPRH